MTASIRVYRNSVLTLNNASSTTPVLLFTAGADGSVVNYISVSSTDTSDRNVAVHMNVSSTNYLMGTVLIPLTCGFVNNVPTISLLGDANFPNQKASTSSNPQIYLGPGSSLYVGMLVAITSGKQIQFAVQAGDF